MNQSPPSPEYTIRAVSNFFENSQRYSQLHVDHRYQFATGVKIATGINDTGGKFATSFTSVVDTGGKFATGVNDTGGKFAACVNVTSGQSWSVNISVNFRKNFKRSKWNTLGLGGN